MSYKFINAVLILALGVMLNSCINTERNIKINKDGSGTENQTLDLSKEFYDIMIAMASAFDSTKTDSIRDSLYSDPDFIRNAENKIGGKDGLTLNSVTAVTNPDSSRTFKLSYNFDKVEKIATAMNINNSDDDKKSKSDISYKESGDKVNFYYKYFSSVDTALQKMSDQQKKEFSSLFEGKALIFNIDFPYDIESSNATGVNGRTATWRFPIDKFYLEKSEFELKAILKK
ncbi:MAG: hypothetical protein NTV87_11295 [Ignavibacteriae bacterium]|nr:hypothetical protein [Ignavibacteriota bacterium]